MIRSSVVVSLKEITNIKTQTNLTHTQEGTVSINSRHFQLEGWGVTRRYALSLDIFGRKAKIVLQRLEFHDVFARSHDQTQLARRFLGLYLGRELQRAPEDQVAVLIGTQKRADHHATVRQVHAEFRVIQLGQVSPGALLILQRTDIMIMNILCFVILQGYC